MGCGASANKTHKEEPIKAPEPPKEPEPPTAKQLEMMQPYKVGDKVITWLGDEGIVKGFGSDECPLSVAFGGTQICKPLASVCSPDEYAKKLEMMKPFKGGDKVVSLVSGLGWKPKPLFPGDEGIVQGFDEEDCPLKIDFGHVIGSLKPDRVCTPSEYTKKAEQMLPYKKGDKVVSLTDCPSWNPKPLCSGDAGVVRGFGNDGCPLFIDFGHVAGNLNIEDVCPAPMTEVQYTALDKWERDRYIWKWEIEQETLHVYCQRLQKDKQTEFTELLKIHASNWDGLSVSFEEKEKKVMLEYVFPGGANKFSTAYEKNFPDYLTQQLKLDTDLQNLRKFIDQIRGGMQEGQKAAGEKAKAAAEKAKQEEKQAEEKAKMVSEAVQGKAQEYLAKVSDQWKQDALQAHNDKRCKGGEGSCVRVLWDYRDELNPRIKAIVRPLTWSDECYILAKRQAEVCSQCHHDLQLGHLEDEKGKYGQNLWKKGPVDPELTPEHVTSMWAVGERSYNFKEPGPQEKTRSFAQVVWMGTTQVGMAKSDCGQYVVANYFPAGPLFNKTSADYKDNVRPWELLEGAEPSADPHAESDFSWVKNSVDAQGNVVFNN